MGKSLDELGRRLGVFWGCFDPLHLILTKESTCPHLDRLLGDGRVVCGLGLGAMYCWGEEGG